ncbi:histone H1-binding protein [Colletotrichum tofieldiae]|uniref:Histone H1-binding protein n=1 Tax=Colletotrichum tofieldiae TaxID=708197 RepID=A0A166XW04_9PEZI|nr:histone H1-binding protein [Colletotrichum tofieldiae]GKT60571.1 histone H1-binding protein [Colletotrichum tofieldiae]GKT68274.1 histone H1-binding protein [Colletotrichum tofieldiae]GKT90717.1 histone H1-binding protein [Colletotrichum tofieldiae]
MADTTDHATIAAEGSVAEVPGAVAPAVEAVANLESKQDAPAPAQQDTPATAGEESEEDSNSKKVTLADLSAKGTALYAKKQYEDAAECFTKAAELQDEINGEMHPKNAEILFLYGRSVFKVGQSKSDVLGGKASGEKKVEKPKTKAPKKAAAEAAPTDPPAESEAQRITEEGVAIVAGEAGGAKTEDKSEEKKPLFQFTGDENFDDESDDEEAEGEGEEEEEEEDDLAVAFGVLDMARVLYSRQLEQLEKKEPNGKAQEQVDGDKLSIKHVKERLADTHDLLAEISLENERQASLYTDDSEIIAEAHFKLSLALEFASVTTTQEEGEQAESKPFDEKLREEAANELEAAIHSTKLKLQNKEVELATMASPEDNEVTRATITDVKDMIADMEQRLIDLRKPPIDVNAALGGDGVGGILGAALGESAAQTQARVEEAKKTATDLTGLVRKKNKDEPKPAEKRVEEAKAAELPANGPESNGTKRKAEELAEADESAKKAKVEEAASA